MTTILGISAFYHDSAAALLKDGELVAAAQEERFTRVKHDESFPENAVRFCLSQAEISIDDVDYVVFYDKPILKFERIFRTYLKIWPRGLSSFLKAIPVWLKKKLWISTELKKHFPESEILYCDHHLSHAASSYYASPYEEAAVVTVDGVGEYETTTIGYGAGSKLNIEKAIHFPHSLGLLYSAFTYYLGFKVNSGEYKVMGLAPYGEPKYVDEVRKLITVEDDGSFELNMRYFSYEHGLRMTNKRFDRLFGQAVRKKESKLEQFHKDVAASLQKVLEEIMLKIVDHAYSLHPSDNLCLAGGVALNCVANGKILKKSKFKNVYIQPASGDAGGALGAAYFVYHHILDNKKGGGMNTPYLGPSFSREAIERFLEAKNVEYENVLDENLANRVAEIIETNGVVGWFQGAMEFGPRALGNRSIIADPRQKENWQRVNLKIKFRESFRPFAPSVLEERVGDFFDIDRPSPYMLLVAPVLGEDVPAVTHVDQSARIQTVNSDQNSRYYDLLKAFDEKTGCPILINTSFNVRGEPIVCTLDDAFTCFMRTDMDYLVLGNYLLDKKNMPKWDESRDDWLNEFELD